MAAENDLVLIYLEDKPLAFARIESILPDSKKDWYHVRLLLLQIPLQVATWILKDVYINGSEFTMNGKRMRLEKVESPVEPQKSDLPGNKKTKKETSQKNKGAKVISLKDLKRKWINGLRLWASGVKWNWLRPEALCLKPDAVYF